MSRHEWYRNTNWDLTIESQFFEKLNRSKSNKWQYLKIQIYCLLKIGDKKLESKIFQLIKILSEEIMNSSKESLSSYMVLEFLDLLSDYYRSI